MANTDDAKNLLLSLIYPITAEDMTDLQSAEFDLAAVEQNEYSSSHSGEIRSETVGDVSIAYDVSRGKGAPFRYYGQPISPAVIGRLSKCGLLKRWV